MISCRPIENKTSPTLWKVVKCPFVDCWRHRDKYADVSSFRVCAIEVFLSLDVAPCQCVSWNQEEAELQAHFPPSIVSLRYWPYIFRRRKTKYIQPNTRWTFSDDPLRQQRFESYKKNKFLIFLLVYFDIEWSRESLILLFLRLSENSKMNRKFEL